MTSDTIRPTTIEGIKRLAKHLKAYSERPQHARALDQASRSAGFDNFTHAHRVLSKISDKRLDQVKAFVYLTGYWRDVRTGNAGRETLCLPLDRTWLDLVTRDQLKIPRALSRFRGQHKDHLVTRDLIRGQDAARSLICHAARELQFMEATGLCPGGMYPKTYPRSGDTLPGEDHRSAWLDPATGARVVVDEPYQAAIVRHLANRQEWAARHRYCITQSPWPGMYAPGQSTMFLLVPEASKPLLENLQAKLSRIDVAVDASDWRGESGGYRPAYRSPCEIDEGRAGSAPADPLLFRDTAKTKVLGSRRRPNGALPVEVHEEIGTRIKAVMAYSFLRPGTYHRLDRVRSELDAWLQREDEGKKLDNDRFFAVYYHGATQSDAPRSLTSKIRIEGILSLERVECLLRRYYPDCAPLREMLGRLNSAKMSLQKWGAEKVAA